jgi:hypothetical protein
MSGADPNAWVIIAVASIAAVGPTIAALGAWRNARQASNAVNGRPAEAPTISDDVATMRVTLAKMHDEQSSMRERFDAHLIDHDRRGRRGRS